MREACAIQPSQARPSFIYISIPRTVFSVVVLRRGAVSAEVGAVAAQVPQAGLAAGGRAMPAQPIKVGGAAWDAAEEVREFGGYTLDQQMLGQAGQESVAG